MYNGTENVKGSLTDRWIWVVGGRYDGEVFNSSVWNALDGGPKQFRARDQMKENPSQLSREYNLYVRTFIPGPPDSSIFSLPSYCENEFERFAKVEWDEIKKGGWMIPIIP